MMNNNVNNNARPLNAPNVAHNFMKVVDERPNYFRTGSLSALQNTFLHFRGFDCTQTFVNALGTEQSVHNIVDGHFSGMSVRRGSTVFDSFLN